jgi:glycosyltransferase involved in cell wall biosynthesis
LKATVIHHSLNTPGGEATLAIETIQSLHELGYKVELITVQKPKLEDITKAYGKSIPINNIKSLFPFKINYFGIYQRLLTSISPIDLKDSDIVINTNGNTLPYRIPNDVPSMLYIHFPTLLLNSVGYSNIKYQSSLFWKTYFKPYHIMSNVLTKKALERSNVVLTNSRFSKEALRKAYPDVQPSVLYPPVDIDRFSIAYQSNYREPQVLVISRFSPEKQIERAIKVARLLKGKIKLKVIGSLVPANRPYFDSLRKMIHEDDLERNIKLTPNATNVELLNAMSTSTIYLHTMYGEHFGVSIVEAMAAGLVPIVPSYGGCSEIVPLEYQYGTLEDAAACILKNIGEINTEKREIIYNIAKQYSPAKFRKMLQQYVDQACNNSITNHSNTYRVTKQSANNYDLLSRR